MRLYQHITVGLVALTFVCGVALAGDDVPKGLNASDWSGIRAAYETNRHSAFACEGGYVAHNPGQQWQTNFDGRGFVTTPDAGDWSWGLELVSFGDTPVSNPCEFKNACGQRVEYIWDDNLTEWYINDGRGLEHGYTLSHRPNEQGFVTFTLTVRGDLCPRISGDGHSVAFINTIGASAVNYGGLTVFDSTGAALPAWFESGECLSTFSSRNLIAATDSELIRIVIDDAKAVYPITIDPIAQQAYLKASNPGGGAPYGDLFGSSVAVSGDTVVVGAYAESSSATGINGNQADNSAPISGAVYVFVRSGGVWSQQAYLKASNTETQDNFGWSVDVCGDTVVVGAQRENSSAKGVNGNQADNSAGDSGAAYVFVRNGDIWSQQAYLKASNTELIDRFGYSVAVCNDTVVVGAYSEDSSAIGVNGNEADNIATNSGAAYVFVRNGGLWSQQAYLKASNTGMDDGFGVSVAVHADTAVIGAHLEDSSAIGIDGIQADNSATDSGAAYVFVRSNGSWSQQAYLKASNTGAFDQFGFSVAVSGNTAVVGALLEDSSATGVNGTQANNSAANSGAAYIFVRSGSVWIQQSYLKAFDTRVDDRFGFSVAASGDTALIGAIREDSGATGVNGNQGNFPQTDSGAAYVFVRSGGVWIQQAYLKASNPGAEDGFGISVAVSGDTVVIGAYRESSSAAGVNGNQADNSALGSGAAYVFVGVGPDTDSDGVPDPVDADIDGDGLDNEIDACPSASPCAPNDTTGRPWSDLNGDCFVNGLDVQVLADCVSGGACSEVDPDGDGVSFDVDLADDIAAFVAATLAPVAAPCP